MKTLNINGVIGWEVNSKDFLKELADANGEDITINVHSPGGSVFEGLAIYNAIKNYSGNVKIKVIGLAASMGSIISMARGKPEVAKSSIFMMHNVQSIAIGDYRDMEKNASITKGMTIMIAKIYSDNSGKKLKDVRDMMDNETYLYGQEIVDNKFAENVFDDGKEETKDDAVAMAQLEFEDCLEKMKSYKENKELVALLTDEFNNIHTEVNTPVVTGNNNQEETSMTLKEILDSNPAAKKEYEDAMTASYNDGETKAKADSENRINRAVAIMKAEKAYPKQVQAIAFEVLEGKKSVETLEALVANADMFAEMLKSNAATGEQQPDSQLGADGQPLSADGIVKNDADVKSAVAEMRNIIGLGGAE